MRLGILWLGLLIFLLLPLASAQACPVISSPGEYTLADDYSGATNPIANGNACILISSSNVSLDCAGHSIANNGTPDNTTGIYVSNLLANVSILNCEVSGYTYDVDLSASFNDTVSNNTLRDSTYPLIMVNPGLGPAMHRIIGNTVYNSTMGFSLFLSTNNTYRDNVAYGSWVGFFAYGGGNNSYINCTSYDNLFGYLIQQSSNNTFANSTIHNNSNGGFYIDTGSNGNLLINNIGYGHLMSAAFLVHSSKGNRYINNTAYGNAYGLGGGGTNVSDISFINNTAYGNMNGIGFGSFNRTTLSGNRIFNNTGTGVDASDSDGTTITGDHYYNNFRDLNVRNSMASGTINLSGVVFDSPYGNFVNFTNLSLDDSMFMGEGYYLDWTTQPGSLNFGYSPVNGTFLTIVQTSGSVSIDRAIWIWNDASLGSLDENKFQLWKYSQGGSRPWSKTPASLNTSANTLTLANFNPSSTYAVLEADDCRDEDGDGAPYAYVTGACAGYTEDCGDENPYLVPPYAGLSLTDNNMVYTLCPGTYSISTPPGDSGIIRIGGQNTTLDCNGTSIINDANGMVVNGNSQMMTAKNCIISDCRNGIYFGWGYQSKIYNNVITNCTYGLDVENTYNATIYGNSIYGAQYGAIFENVYNASFFSNIMNSSSSSYVASNQHLTYSGALFDGGFGATLFVPSDVFAGGSEPCTVDADGQSLAACPAYDGTQDLSVILNDLTPLGFGPTNTTIIMNEQFADCSEVDAWWDSQIGMHPPCYYACVLYTANGAGSDYTLNEDCFNALVNVSSGLTYPPYVRYGSSATYGIQLTHSSGNLLYNNLFAVTDPAQDSNNGYFQDYFASFSPITYNGREYNGSASVYQVQHTLFLHNTNNGWLGGSDWVGPSAETLVNADDTDGTRSYGVFLANLSTPGYTQYMTIYFDNSELNWHSCADVEGDLYRQLRPGDCNAFCRNILTAHGYGSNYSFDPSCITGNFNVTPGYTYPPHLRYDNYSVVKNAWNTAKRSGPNIIGGSYIGGNYYPDYTGFDTTGDGIGDDPPYYDITNSGGATAATDNLPLTNNENLSGCVDLNEPSTYGTKVVGNLSAGFYVHEDTVLCKDTYAIDGDGYGAAFIVFYDDITLDCAGSAIIGPDGNTGVYMYGSGTEVRNCNVRDYGTDVYGTPNAENCSYYNLNLSAAFVGLAIQDASGARGDNITVSGMHFPGPVQNQGVALLNADNAFFSNLHVSDVGSMGEGFGIGIDDNTDNLTIMDSEITGCGMDGIDWHGTNLHFSNISVSGSVIGVFVATWPASGAISDSLISENYYADMFALTCDFNASGITGSGGREILVLGDADSGGSFSNLNVSELMVCGMHDSAVSNVVIEGSSVFQNNGLMISDGSSGNTISNITSNNNFVGAIFTYAGDGNVIDGLYASGSLAGVSYGIDAVEDNPGNLPGASNAIRNVVIDGADEFGLEVTSGSSGLTARNLSISNSANPLWLEWGSGNTISGATIRGATGGYAVDMTANATGNVLENILVYDSSSYISQDYTSGPVNNITNLSVSGSTLSSRLTWHGLRQDSMRLDSSVVAFDDDFVSLDSAAVPEFDSPATITLNVGSCAGFDRTRIFYAPGMHASAASIISSGSVCPDSLCTNIECNGGVVTFDVAHFTGYAYGANANLTISSNGPVPEGQNITFNASYINATSGAHIPGASCNLTLYNGSTYPMAELSGSYELNLTVFVPGVHNYNVTCAAPLFSGLTALDTYTVLGSGANGSMIELHSANVTVISDSRYGGNATAANHTTEGGNVTNLDLYGNESTDRWAGYYGNITAGIVLAQSGDTQMMYNWTWNSSSGGVVCTTTLSSFTSANVSGASGSDIDYAWNFSASATDSGANTFNNPNCSMDFGPATVGEAYYADTGFPGGFRTCSFKTSALPAKNDMLFCTNITYNGPIYNGETGDFEMMVPTAYGLNIFETYYFYLNLN